MTCRTERDGGIMDAPTHDARDVHRVNERDEAVTRQQTVAGLQRHNATQRSWVPGGAARVRAQSADTER